VQKELRARSLTGAWPADLPPLAITMEVRAYRARPSGKQPAKGTAQALWGFLGQAAQDGTLPKP
jgi:LysR family transcriptional regulator, hypochlorite-specific transcription factor HypT